MAERIEFTNIMKSCIRERTAQASYVCNDIGGYSYNYVAKYVNNYLNFLDSGYKNVQTLNNTDNQLDTTLTVY